MADEAALGHYTHEKSPLAAAAALATLDVVEEEGLGARSVELGARMVGRLRAMRHPVVREVRGLGLLIGVEMRDAHRAESAMYECLSRGLSFKVSSGTVLTLTPPLTLTDGEAELALSILDAALAAV